MTSNSAEATNTTITSEKVRELLAVVPAGDGVGGWWGTYPHETVASLCNSLLSAREEIERLRTVVWNEIDKLIDDAPVDGKAATGERSDKVAFGQRKYVDGIRAARLRAMNAIAAALANHPGDDDGRL